MCTSLNYACRSWYFLGFVTLLLTASIWGGTDCSWFVNKILKSEFIFIMSHCLMSSTHFPIEIGLKYASLVLIIDWNVEPQLGHGWICSTPADLCLAPSLPLCFSQTRHKDPFIRLLPHGLKVLSDSEAVCWQKRQTTCEIFSFAVLWLVLRQLLAIFYISKYKVVYKYSVKLICRVLFKIHV